MWCASCCYRLDRDQSALAPEHEAEADMRARFEGIFCLLETAGAGFACPDRFLHPRCRLLLGASGR